MALAHSDVTQVNQGPPIGWTVVLVKFLPTFLLCIPHCSPLIPRLPSDMSRLPWAVSISVFGLGIKICVQSSIAQSER